MISLLGGASVLVIDDDRDSLEILKYFLGEAGGIVRGARTGKEALDVLSSWVPDVMLLDISMPDMDGYELLSTIRAVASLRDVPAVAVTARAYEHDRRRCLAAGFAHHVSKPFGPTDLLDLLAGLLPRKLPSAV